MFQNEFPQGHVVKITNFTVAENLKTMMKARIKHPYMLSIGQSTRVVEMQNDMDISKFNFDFIPFDHFAADEVNPTTTPIPKIEVEYMFGKLILSNYSYDLFFYFLFYRFNGTCSRRSWGGGYTTKAARIYTSRQRN